MPKNLSFGPRLNQHLAAKEAELLGRRFCTNHQGMAPTEGGELRGSRWCCAACTANRINRTQTWKKK